MTDKQTIQSYHQVKATAEKYGFELKCTNDGLSLCRGGNVTVEAPTLSELGYWMAGFAFAYPEASQGKIMFCEDLLNERAELSKMKRAREIRLTFTIRNEYTGRPIKELCDDVFLGGFKRNPNVGNQLLGEAKAFLERLIQQGKIKYDH